MGPSSSADDYNGGNFNNAGVNQISMNHKNPSQLSSAVPVSIFNQGTGIGG